MKAAFTVWENRIAPLFDVARYVHIIEIDDGKVIHATQQRAPDGMMSQKAMLLLDEGVETLVCGAISRSTQAMLTEYGIQVIPFVAGNLDEVIQAWLGGRLNADIFAMPGCRGRGCRRLDGMLSQNGKGIPMNGRQGGMGQGGGRGKGGGRGRGGGMGGGATGLGIGGNCLCPKCGFREKHERGMPCFQKQCPKCGATMVRE